jgi:glycosyltransferase involved in cell wall biosynthesis
MGRGPENFLSRLNQALTRYDLPSNIIINPHPDSLHLLSKKDVIKVGRLDGAIYYKITQENLFNLIHQRRGKKIQVIKKIPKWIIKGANYPINRYLNRSNRALLNQSDILVYQSKFSKQMQDKFVGTSNKSSAIILNGTPREMHLPKKNIQTNSVNMVITASFRLHKRLQDAIDLINKLNRINLKKYKLHVIGDMDILTKNVVNAKDTSNCIFYGRVKTKELPSLYSRFDLGLSPSLFDPCPNSVVEMIACGLPVISTSESGAAELIKNKDLLVYEDTPLCYMELQTASKIPKIDLKLWADTVGRVLEDREKYSEFMNQRFEEELNIEITAKKYAKHIVRCYESRN